MRYRKSKTAGPFRFTLSSRGISSSVGLGPLRLTRGAGGRIRRTVRVPGTGFSSSRTIGHPAHRHHHTGRVVILTLFGLGLFGRFPWLFGVLAVCAVLAVIVVVCVRHDSSATVPSPDVLAAPPPEVAPAWGPPITAPRNGLFGTRFD